MYLICLQEKSINLHSFFIILSPSNSQFASLECVSKTQLHFISFPVHVGAERIVFMENFPEIGKILPTKRSKTTFGY